MNRTFSEIARGLVESKKWVPDVAQEDKTILEAAEKVDDILDRAMALMTRQTLALESIARSLERLTSKI